jgi:Acetyltransferase (GNAT) domain
MAATLPLRVAELDGSSASLSVQVDGQTPASWADILARFADASIYQSWAYGAVRWGERNLSHLVLRRDGQVVAAAQLRIARLPMIPAGLAYLRWGLFEEMGRPFDPAVVVEMMARLRHEYVDRRGLALQVIPPAFAEGAHAPAFYTALEQSGLRPEPFAAAYRTILVDLTPPADMLRKGLNQKWRNQLNRAEKNGLALEVSDSAAAYREFVPLYQSMWERKQFESSVDVEEFARVQALLSGAARMQTFLARSGGEVIGASVCSLMGNHAIYLLGATNEQARELKAAYFLQWQAMLWLKARGARTYDLGGIDPDANPGGYHFKSGFGGTAVSQLAAHGHRGNMLSSGVAAFAAWRRRRHQS